MEITFDRKTVSSCLQQRFVLPTYQREYRWETKHLQELLIDIQEEFLDQYEPSHGRSRVGEYRPYFLGTIITTTGLSGSRAIVDGQQRLTTLAIILAYFYKKALGSPDAKITNVEPLLRRQIYGVSQFNIEFDLDRQKLFEILLETDGSQLDVELPARPETLEQRVDSIENITESTRSIFNLFNQIDNFLLDDVRTNLFPNFVDYLVERVYLFEIGVPSEQDGHKVFVTMNDRGLKLGPIDLLKVYLLSNIENSEFNARANRRWTECIRDLRHLGSDEDSSFFKTWLRAQYAMTIRGKSKGDPARDFEVIGDAYHRWTIENSSSMGLVTSDDFYNLVESQIPIFHQHYRRIKHAENNFGAEFPHVFYNGAKNLTLQYMAILSSIDVNDTGAAVEKKIRIVSYYMDYYSSMRLINRKDNNYDNIRDYIF